MGIMDQFSLSCESHSISKLAALTQALITIGSPSAQPTRLSNLSTLSSSPEPSLIILSKIYHIVKCFDFSLFSQSHLI